MMINDYQIKINTSSAELDCYKEKIRQNINDFQNSGKLKDEKIND
jgi:hypothetical protein